MDPGPNLCNASRECLLILIKPRYVEIAREIFFPDRRMCEIAHERHAVLEIIRKEGQPLFVSALVDERCLVCEEFFYPQPKQ